MSGPALGTLLIQRLDAALGTTLSQQTTIVNRLRPDAVTQPGQPARNEPVSGSLVRHPRESVDRATSHAAPDSRVAAQHTAETAIGSGRTVHAATTSATTTLGPAARIILNLLSRDSFAALPVAGRTPLISTAPQHATAAGDFVPRLTRALRQALQHSGLFYESHLRAMATGQYRLRDILQEPQALLTTGPKAGPLAAPESPASAAPTPGVDPATHAVVRQQLETLADQTVQWRGEAWPGANMEWHIQGEPDRDRPDTDDTPHADWTTLLRLQLPGLGDITVDLGLRNGQLHLALQADELAAPLLQDQADALRKQLLARRLQVASLSCATRDPDAS